MPKPQKVEAVESIKRFLEEADSVFVTDYVGLNVADITLLRKNLRDNSIKYLIAKNTLIRIAARESGYENLLDYLKGPTAIAFAKEDPAVAAKILYDSYKDKEKPVIRAFVLEDQVFTGEQIKRLADLPSREVLLASVVSAIEAPFSSMLSSIDAIFQELVATVDALAAAKEKQ